VSAQRTAARSCFFLTLTCNDFDILEILVRVDVARQNSAKEPDGKQETHGPTAVLQWEELK
jgi:hypothetical protein